MPVSDAKKKANNKWDAAHMQNLSVKVRREYAAQIREKAAAKGTTIGAILRVFYALVRKTINLSELLAQTERAQERARERARHKD